MVVLANDHPALGDVGVLQSCAPDAIVFDLCGVLPEHAVEHITIERFGRGRVSTS